MVFMPKASPKNWKKVSEVYKLKVRMLKKRMLLISIMINNVALCGDATVNHGKYVVCMIVEDIRLVSVVGKCRSMYRILVDEALLCT